LKLYETTITLSNHDRYRFAGWSTSPERTRVDYLPGETINVFDNKAKLYDVWEKMICLTISPNPTSNEMTENKYVYFPKSTGGRINISDLYKIDNMTTGANINNQSLTRENYEFEGWGNNAEATVALSGNINITQDTTIYALWSMRIDKIDWKQDVHSSIGSLSLANNGKTVTMKGNRRNPGKNAIWTNIDYDIKSISFDYSVNFGDSFNAAGVLLSVKEVNGKLEGYMISFNNYTWKSQAANKTGAIWKFTYDMNNYTNMNKTLVSSLNINTSGTLKIDIDDETIKISGGGLTNPVNISDSNINRNSFGFFSDHYSHNCSSIGQFNLNNIKVFVEEE